MEFAQRISLLKSHFWFDKSQHLVLKSSAQGLPVKSPVLPCFSRPTLSGADGSALVWKDVENPLRFLAGGKEVPEPLDSAVLGASDAMEAPVNLIRDLQMWGVVHSHGATPNSCLVYNG